MRTIQNDDSSLHELLGMYDAPAPSEAFRTRLYGNLQAELQHATCAVSSTQAPTAADKSQRRLGTPGWTGAVTAALLLAVAGVGMLLAVSSRDVVQQEKPETPQQAPAVSSIADETSIPQNRVQIADSPEQLLTTTDAAEQDEVAAIETDELAPAASASSVSILDEPVAEPMQFVLHSDVVFTSPEDRLWRKAWCYLTECEVTTDIFDGWQAACAGDTATEGTFKDEMGYRLQSAALARAQIAPLAQPLLDDADQSGEFLGALLEMEQDSVNQTVAQLSGEMATSAKLYLELLLRSREDHGIHSIDAQLQSSLTSEQLDESRRQFVQQLLKELEVEKRRRQLGSVMM